MGGGGGGTSLWKTGGTKSLEARGGEEGDQVLGKLVAPVGRQKTGVRNHTTLRE